MQRLAPPILGLLVPLALTGGVLAQTPTDHHLVEVRIQDTRHLLRLLRLDPDLASCRLPEAGARRVEIIADDADVLALTKHGFRPRIAIRNLEDHYEAELKRNSLGQVDTLTPPLGQGAMGGHYTLAQIEAILDQFARSFPKLCSQKVSIGKSHENRDIWMVKISDNVAVDENEPEVYYDALHHAREPLSMEATLLFMDELLDGYGNDPEATFLIDERELYFVPCVNPDGYEYNRQTRPNGGGLWRKNRRNHGGGVFGVDLNRNYSTGWSAPNGGSSNNQSSNTYRGAAAFSEPETAAVDAFARSRSFVNTNSCHTYTEILLEPWGYRSGGPANAAEYALLGQQLLATNPMTRGPASAILYVASGTALDYHHAERGSFSWSPELGLSSEGGFWPAGANIVNIARRHQPMFRAIARTAGAAFAIASITVTEAVGNGNGRVEAGEQGAVVIEVANNGAGSAGASAQLRAISPGVTIQNGTASLGTLARFSRAAHSATPLLFTAPPQPAGIRIELEATVTGDGRTLRRPLTVLLQPLTDLIVDDMERDRGFTRAVTGTATTGLWARGVPQQTTSGGRTYQPGSDHTPGAGTRCWVTDPLAGTSVGDRDVDGGYTDLLSPVLDLSHVEGTRFRFFRWFEESQGNDPFEVFVSADAGANWTPVLRSSASTGGWSAFEYEFPSRTTATTQIRIRAQDANASLVEAAIDDFSLRGVTAAGNLTVMTSGARGSTIQIGVHGRPGGRSIPLFGIARAPNPIGLPGIGGLLRLDPTTTVLLPAVTVGTPGTTALDITIPNDPGLSGRQFYFQALYEDPTGTRFGNLQAFRVR